MAEAEKVTGSEETIPLGQVFLDDIFLLFTLGMSVPLVLYIGWGLLDLLNVPILP
ncbi:MAG: hypothetical protein QGH66_03685 [Dehalococcoidia bacterium]|jgi:hypothetical protein|nr:hypothetical protein [Dehalococcoidia bacterium]MDP7239788.1 hypothetical protein [Dehalococcoidia bacterium]MDP7469940.1 hypothetical protein [Dehalococcoidia bacterium]